MRISEFKNQLQIVDEAKAVLDKETKELNAIVSPVLEELGFGLTKVTYVMVNGSTALVGFDEYNTSTRSWGANDCVLPVRILEADDRIAATKEWVAVNEKSLESVGDV